jgi:hypothetical protein
MIEKLVSGRMGIWQRLLKLLLCFLMTVDLLIPGSGWLMDTGKISI